MRQLPSSHYYVGGSPYPFPGIDREAPYRFQGIDRDSHPSNHDHWVGDVADMRALAANQCLDR